MIVGTRTERPPVFPVLLGDGKVVDAGDAPPHQAVLSKLPVLVAVAPEPISAVVMPLIGEAHGDAVVTESPQLLDQAIVELAVPLAREEGHDLGATAQELGAVSPYAVLRVGECDSLRLACVPGILGLAHLLDGGVETEWRKGRTFLAHGFSHYALGVEVSAPVAEEAPFSAVFRDLVQVEAVHQHAFLGLAEARDQLAEMIGDKGMAVVAL